MAALDPSAAPKHTGTANGDALLRATLKIVYEPVDPNEDSDGGSEDEKYLKALLQGQDGSEGNEKEDSSSDEEEKNGGPSDPSKSRKARKQAAVEQMMKALAEKNSDDSDDEMGMDNASDANGVVSNTKKGKAKATEEHRENGDDEDEDEEEGLEELVLCTLDPIKIYQQPLDLTIGEDQRAFFKVSGTHAIYLTGNYVIPAGSDHDHQHGEEEDEDYDLSPDEDEIYGQDESDALDDIEDPRITEIQSEDDVPKQADKEEPFKKGKNKRVAEESLEGPANLDEIMAKSMKPEESAANNESKLSKKQRKKLKNNAGKGVEAVPEKKGKSKNDQIAKGSPEKGDKKVQFAKNLEQGPSNAEKHAKSDSKIDSRSEAKPDSQKEGDKQRPRLGTKNVQGVKIEDKKLGKGPAATKGDRVGMRYIGKLTDGKVFDANKKGSPFSFKLGTGEVIKGWDIGVAGMSVGGERRITVPAPLAYGNKSLPGIPANSQLIFDVKLLEIK